MTAVCFLVALLACLIGKICGMGGGVIIKPTFDAIGLWGVSTINFLSGCTVLGMSAWSVGKTFVKKEKAIDFGVSTPLGIGAAAGGLVGKSLFGYASSGLTAEKAGGVQAVILLVLVATTLFYALRKDKLKSFHVKNKVCCGIIGLLLGCIGAFLGIGGGPFNVAVLFLFFSMQTKSATQNSLYIILLSQLTSLVKTIVSGKVPSVSLLLLFGMVICGIAGSEIGSRIHKRIDDRMNTSLLAWSMVLVMLITCYNIRLLF